MSGKICLFLLIYISSSCVCIVESLIDHSWSSSHAIIQTFNIFHLTPPSCNQGATTAFVFIACFPSHIVIQWEDTDAHTLPVILT